MVCRGRRLTLGGVKVRVALLDRLGDSVLVGSGLDGAEHLGGQRDKPIRNPGIHKGLPPLARTNDPGLGRDRRVLVPPLEVRRLVPVVLLPLALLLAAMEVLQGDEVVRLGAVVGAARLAQVRNQALADPASMIGTDDGREDAGPRQVLDDVPDRRNVIWCRSDNVPKGEGVAKALPTFSVGRLEPVLDETCQPQHVARRLGVVSLTAGERISPFECVSEVMREGARDGPPVEDRVDALDLG